MSKKKKAQSKLNRKRELLAHVQYFYGIFAVLAVGAVMVGFMQPTTSTQVLGAHDSAVNSKAEDIPISIADFGEALWYTIVNVLPIR